MSLWGTLLCLCSSASVHSTFLSCFHHCWFVFVCLCKSLAIMFVEIIRNLIVTVGKKIKKYSKAVNKYGTWIMMNAWRIPVNLNRLNEVKCPCCVPSKLLAFRKWHWVWCQHRVRAAGRRAGTQRCDHHHPHTVSSVDSHSYINSADPYSLRIQSDGVWKDTHTLKHILCM